MGHPSLTAIIRFLKLAQPGVPVTDEDVNNLKAIIASCLICERFGNSPRRIRVATPMECVFNLCVAIDFVKLHNMQVLSMVCMGTVLRAAEVVESHTAAAAFDVFFQSWVTKYVGAPQYVVVDQEPSLQSKEFALRCAEIGTTVVNKSVEAHWSFGSGERFHSALRDTWYRTVLDSSLLPLRARSLLSLCVFSLNSAPDSIGRASGLLVFGQIPRPLTARLDEDTCWPLIPTHERLAIQAVAREAAEVAVNKSRLHEVRRRAFPDECAVTKPGQLCYVYRESGNSRDKRPAFVGPFVFLHRDKNDIWLLVGTRPRPFPSTHVRAAPASDQLPVRDAVQIGSCLEKLPRLDAEHRPDPSVETLFASFWNLTRNNEIELESTTRHDMSGTIESSEASDNTNADASAQNDQKGNAASEGSNDVEVGYATMVQSDCAQVYFEQYSCSVSELSHSIKRDLHSRISEYQAAINAADVDATVYITEIVSEANPKFNREEANKAIESELTGLIQTGAITFVQKDEVPRQSNVIGTRIVLGIKNPGSDDERWKARLVIQGCMDAEAETIVSDAASVSSFSIRILLLVSLYYNWAVWTVDATQAYLHSGNLSRILFGRLPRELRAKLRGWLIRIVKPVYGLKESGAYWFALYLGLWLGIGMLSTEVDPCLLYRKDDENGLNGAAALMTDDGLLTGPAAFAREERDMHLRGQIPIGKRCDLNEGAVRFGGMTLTKANGSIFVNQAEYLEQLKPKKLRLHFVPTLTEVKSAAGGLGWLGTQTRIDIAVKVSIMNQITQSDLSPDTAKFVNKTIDYVLSTQDRGLRFPRMDLSTAYIACYGDASLATNVDLTSQMGGIVCLRDAEKNVTFLAWHSKKCPRVVSSILAGETIAAVTIFDLAFAIRHTLSVVTGRKLDLFLYTDSYSMFSTVTRYQSIREKRLLIDLSILRQGYRTKDISNVGFVRSEDMLADPLTKDISCQLLTNAMDTGKLDHPVQEFIVSDDRNVDVSILYADIPQ